MRSIVWLLLVAVIAVVGATALGANDGLVTIYWRGWRTDFSLNLFLLVMAALFLAVYSLVRALDGLLALPERAKQWRTSRRDRVAQAALREGLALYLAGRYTRAHKTCQKAIAIQADTPELALDAEFTALAHMLSAGSLHRLQDRTRRDEHLQRALEMARMTRKPRATEEGARLMSAESALEDRDAARALRELSELPPGVARRTQALRLKLQAARLARQPMEALRTARLLAKHQGFTPSAAEGLLRTLASETLEGARDADQMRALWVNLDMQDKRDPLLVANAARRSDQRSLRLGEHTFDQPAALLRLPGETICRPPAGNVQRWCSCSGNAGDRLRGAQQRLNGVGGIGCSRVRPWLERSRP